MSPKNLQSPGASWERKGSCVIRKGKSAILLYYIQYGNVYNKHTYGMCAMYIWNKKNTMSI